MADDEPDRRDYEALTQREIRELLLEIRRQNVVLKRYMMAIGLACLVSLLMQSDIVAPILQIAVVVVIVLAILLTAPKWSHAVLYVTDRIPWTSTKKPKDPWSAERPT